MKTLSRIVPFTTAWLAISAMIAVVGLTESQAETKKKNAEVQSVNGTATYQVAGGPVTEIKAGDTIPEGAVITTAPGSSVDLFLGRNTGVLRLAEDSALKIAVFQETGTGADVITDTHLELQKGECLGQVSKQSSGSTYQITLPDGVVDLKQSRFQIANRAVENLTENPNAKLGGSTQSTIRFVSGEGQFVKDGSVFQFKGAGEYSPGANSVAPLSSETKQTLTAEFNAIDSKNLDSGSENNPSNKSTQFAKVDQTTVQPQETILSPTTGASN